MVTRLRILDEEIWHMLAMKNTEILAYGGDSLINFIEEKLDVHFKNNSNDVLIMDNCNFHHRKDVVALLK